MLIVFLYVEYLILTSDFGIEYFKAVMESEFEMTDLGLKKFFLGIESSNVKVVYLYHSLNMQVQF